MIRPVEMQLSVWRADQNVGQQTKDPAAAAAQATQQGEMIQEAQIRDHRVQEGQETGTEDRVTDRRQDRQDRRQRRKAPSEKISLEEENLGKTSTPLAQNGLDFYA